jgi:hypothetical protein
MAFGGTLRFKTTHLRFEPHTLLERLATLTPRPRISVLLSHGILAPHAAGAPPALAYRLSAAGELHTNVSALGPAFDTRGRQGLRAARAMRHGVGCGPELTAPDAPDGRSR